MSSSLWHRAEHAIASALDVGVDEADLAAVALVRELAGSKDGRVELVQRLDWGGNTLFMKACAFGLSKTVKLMLNEGVVVAEHHNADRATAESLAQENGHELCVQLIKNPKLAVVEKTDDAPAEAWAFGALDSLVADDANNRSGAGTGKFRTLNHVFRELDKDRSGKIAKPELEYGLSMLGIHVTLEEFEDLWAHMDADGSGEVGFREFKTTLTHFRKFDRAVLGQIQTRIKERLAADGTDLATLLAPHDTGGMDGALDYREFRAFLRTDLAMGPGELPDAEITRMTKALDPSGQISIEQVENFVENGIAALWGGFKPKQAPAPCEDGSSAGGAAGGATMDAVPSPRSTGGASV